MFPFDWRNLIQSLLPQMKAMVTLGANSKPIKFLTWCPACYAVSILTTFVSVPGLAQAPLSRKTVQQSAEITRLQQLLETYGFQVKSGRPPKRGVYGFLNVRTKVIWINPAVFELGIARPTLVHEAVHAAQRCASGEKMLPLGLDITPPKITRPHFLRYHGFRQQVEAEAYAVQTHPNGVTIAINLLNQHCR